MEKKVAKFKTSAKFTAEASAENPNLGWLEFVLTDNTPNANKVGIKETHFASLVESGIFMPLKMAAGEIRPDHSDAVPLGTIVELASAETVVAGKAAVWKEDRATDYKMLKTKRENNEDINISWELAFTKSTVDEDGIEWLEDPILTAATIVGMPAYQGRTPVTRVASQEDPEEEPEEETPEEPVTEEPTETPELASRLEDLENEVKALREYKEQREKQDADAAKFKERVDLFREAGFDFASAEEMENKREAWLEMSDTAFSTMLEMLKEMRTSTASFNPGIPDLGGSETKNDLEVVREGFKSLRTGG